MTRLAKAKSRRQAKRPTPAWRRALYGKIQIGLKQLAIDEPTYRLMLQARYGKDSRTQLTRAELVDLVEYLVAQGFTPQKKRPPARAKADRLADGDQAKKARALWVSLYHLGVVLDPSEKALNDLARRMSGAVDRLEWLDGESLYRLTEALKKWAEREAGVTWSPWPLPGGDTADLPRHRVIQAQLRLLADHTPSPVVSDALAPIGGRLRLDSHTDENLDAAIEALGALVRAAKRG